MFESDFALPSVAVRPLMALLVFSGSRETAITVHDLKETNSTMQIGAGRLMSVTDQASLRDALATDGRGLSCPFLPSTVLAMGSAYTVWLVRGAVRRMYFSVNRRPVSFLVPWPTLVFAVVGGLLYLTALRSVRRPTPAARCFHAPLMNIDDIGSVCLGTASAPHDSGLSACAGWEGAVFDTNFSHVSHPHTLHGAGEVSTSAHLRFWKGLHGAAVFPAERLAPLGLSLGEWLLEIGVQ